MGYSVTYRPERKRAQRQTPATKAKRTKEIKKAIRFNLPQLEHDTTGADTIQRSMIVQLPKLNKIAPQADPTGTHVMQQLISDGYVSKPKRVAGALVFDRADLLQSLKAYAGML